MGWAAAAVGVAFAAVWHQGARLPAGGSTGVSGARVACVADANLSSYEGEARWNYGASSRIRLKGIQMLGVFRFDLGSLGSMRITRACLRLRYAGGDRQLRTLGLSTVSAPWDEGSGTGSDLRGAACFAERRRYELAWDGPETDFTDVSFAAGNTIAAYGDLRDLGAGWFEVDVDPRIVQAQVCGCSFGMAVTDEKGQTMANNDVFSREQSQSAPYLIVDAESLGPAVVGPAGPVAVSPHAAGDRLGHGALSATFSCPAGSHCLDVEYRLAGGSTFTALARSRTPRALPGRLQAIAVGDLLPARSYEVRLRAKDGAGRPGPWRLARGMSSRGLPKPRALSADPMHTAAAPALGAGPVRLCDAGSLVDPVSGRDLTVPGGAGRTFRGFGYGSLPPTVCRGEIASFQVIVTPRTLPADVTVAIAPVFRTGSGVGGVNLSPAVFRTWYVRAASWRPEACVPVTGASIVPWPENRVPGQTNQSFWVDLHVPRNASPGVYAGSVSVSVGGSITKLPIAVRVADVEIPSTLSFDVSLNTYGTTGRHYGIDDRSARYRLLEREYHRLCHAHRCTLAPLGYSHGGSVSSNYAPPLAGAGGGLHVPNWASWDEQFGPYLDGSAFRGLPRDGVPLAHFYLPFHEAWPSDIRRHYGYRPASRQYPAMIAEHALFAPPIELAMGAGYSVETGAVAANFGKHVVERGWKRTSFQLYFNNKFYYRDPALGGRGTSWWLLDEPNHRDDWLALRYLSRCVLRGWPSTARSLLAVREDVSRPQWQRDYLDGDVDLMVVGSEMFGRRRLLERQRRALRVGMWNYGEAPPPGSDPAQIRVWALRAWFAGADGIVPWQSVGPDQALDRPDSTALIVPGKRFGIDGPLATVRLKALRRAQQDIELLGALARSRSWTRDQAAAALVRLLPDEAVGSGAKAEEAGRSGAAEDASDQLTSLRRALVTELSTVRDAR